MSFYLREKVLWSSKATFTVTINEIEKWSSRERWDTSWVDIYIIMRNICRTVLTVDWTTCVSLCLADVPSFITVTNEDELVFGWGEHEYLKSNLRVQARRRRRRRQTDCTRHPILLMMMRFGYYWCYKFSQSLMSELGLKMEGERTDHLRNDTCVRSESSSGWLQRSWHCGWTQYDSN